MREFGSNANIQPSPNPKPLRVQRGTACIATKDEKGNVKEGEWTDALVHGVSVLPTDLLRKR